MENINNKEILKLFLRFLKNNNAYSNYLKDIDSWQNDKGEITLGQHLKRLKEVERCSVCSPSSMIMGNIWFTRSKMGPEYWLDIHGKWIKYIKKQTNE